MFEKTKTETDTGAWNRIYAKIYGSSNNV